MSPPTISQRHSGCVVGPVDIGLVGHQNVGVVVIACVINTVVTTGSSRSKKFKVEVGGTVCHALPIRSGG